MALNLRNRSFLKEIDFTTEEMRFLLKLSADLKAAKYAGTEFKIEDEELLIVSQKDILAVVEG